MNVHFKICSKEFPDYYIRGMGEGGIIMWTPYKELAKEFDSVVSAKLWIIKYLFNPFLFKVIS